MKTTGQSEEVRNSLAQEEQNPDAGEEQSAPTPDEQNEQATPEEETSSSPAEAAEADNAHAADSVDAAEVSEESAAPRKKRTRKKADQIDVQKFSSRHSYWPIALAFSLIVAFIGLADSPIVLGIGVLMIIVSVIGWGLER